MIALVAGGTGLVGTHLVQYLCADPTFDQVKVLVRKSTQNPPKKVEIITVDYDDLPAFDDLLKADVAFCCLGTTIKKAGSKQKFRMVDYDYPLTLAKLLAKVGCRQFNIITAMGADKKSIFFYNQVKGEIEESLQGLWYGNLNIFRPSLLLGVRPEKRFGEQFGAMVMKIISPLMLGPLSKYKAVHAQAVALAMLIVSKKGLSGNHIFQSDVIRQLGHLQG